MNPHLNKTRRLILATLAGLSALASHAKAPAWPSKAVTIIVPFAAGGATDVLARALGQQLGLTWGQPVVIENRAGAGGNIGAAVAAKAAPDGNTLMMASGSIMTINPHLYSKMPFDVNKDFVPVTNVAAGPMVVTVPASSKISTIAELIAQAKAEPGRISFGSAGPGSQVHMAGESLAYAGGVSLMHVPYKGEAAALADLMAGQVQLVVGNIGAVAGLLPGGRLRVLAVTSRERSKALPDVPTVAESGLPGFENLGWFGLIAPVGTPAAVVQKIQHDTGKALATADMQARLATLGMVDMSNSPQDFKKAIEEESKRWATLISARKLQIDGQ